MAKKVERSVALGRVEQPNPGPEHKLLDVFIGKWINEGQTVASGEEPPVKILTSDIYEWVPGGFFIIHSAYGRIGNVDVGGTEIIGCDAESKKYRSYFFDSLGNVTVDDLTVQGGNTWIWQGKNTRTTVTFTDNGKTQIARHERSDDGTNWVPSMDVTLTKVE